MDTEAAHSTYAGAMTESANATRATQMTQIAVAGRDRIGVLPLFAVTIFLGAVLVFGVQPIVARLLLPHFGGSPAVWSASSVFFQVALLAGYGYSYLITRYVAPRFQPVLHLPVLVLPLVFLPLALPLADGSFAALPPAISVMTVLAIGAGVPFVVASTTGPLLQRWFSFTGHRSAADPYFLYAASNTGSLLVLVAYPFVLEPRLTLGQQSTTWSIGYAAFAMLAAACAIVVLRTTRRGIGRASAEAREAPGDAAAEPTTALSWWTRARWLVLAAVPSALSLGVTQHISTDIAAIPLLWIAPLALYLLSFVAAFSPGNPLTARRAGLLMPLAAAAVVVAPFLSLPVWLLLGVHLAFLFVAAVMCHSRLAEERPAPSRLTEFYLLLSVGGALGGAFVSLVAPVAFDRVWEYPIAIVAALLLRPRVGGRITRRALVGAAVAVTVAAVVIGISLGNQPALAGWIGLALLAVAVVATGRWLVPPAAVTGVIMATMLMGVGDAIHTDRTFFGVYRVTSAPDHHALVHGTTVHGMQFTEADRRSVATSYFHASGPIGQVFAARGTELERVAVVGLGVGTLATYGHPGQEMTFYEIDPAVVELARDPRLFTYVADSAAQIDLVVADGRLGIAADPSRYDLIVIDAFSSDAIPVHLLTREAVRIYADHLDEGGLLAFHITNRFVDLEPVLGAVAASLDLQALVQGDHDVTEAQAADGKRPSTWFLMAGMSTDLGSIGEDARWRTPDADPVDRAWTDGYSDLIGALR